VWKFQGDREEERHQYVERAIGKIRFCESTLHCQLYPQLWDGNWLLVSKTEMNEWLSVRGIGKCVPAVSGGIILLGSSRGGETNKKDMWEKTRGNE